MALVLSTRNNNSNNLQLAVSSATTSLAPNLLGRHHSRFTLSSENKNNKNNNNNGELVSTCFSRCSENNFGRLIATSDLHGNISVWQTTRSSLHPSTEKSDEANEKQQQQHAVFHPKLMSTFHLRAPVTRVKFALDDTVLVCSQANGQVSIIDVVQGKITKTFSVVVAAAFGSSSSNGNNKNRKGQESNKSSNNTNNNNNNNKIKIHPFENAIVLNDVAVCPNNSSVFATCGDDGRICVFDLKNILQHNNVTPLYQYFTGIPQTCLVFGGSTTTKESNTLLFNIFSGGVDGCLRWFQTSSSSSSSNNNNNNEDKDAKKSQSEHHRGKPFLRCIVECPDAHDDIISGIDVIVHSHNNERTSSTFLSGSCSQVLSFSVSGMLRIHDLRPFDDSCENDDDGNEDITTTPKRDVILFEDDLSRIFSNDEDDEDNENADRRQRRRKRIDNSLLRCSFSPVSGDSIVASVPQEGGAGLVIYQNIQQFLLLTSSSSSSSSSSNHQNKNATTNKNTIKTSFIKQNRYFVNPHQGGTVTDVCFHPKSDPVTLGESVILSCSLDGSCVVAAI